jgi:hypothetical protein
MKALTHKAGGRVILWGGVAILTLGLFTLSFSLWLGSNSFTAAPSSSTKYAFNTQRTAFAGETKQSPRTGDSAALLFSVNPLQLLAASAILVGIGATGWGLRLRRGQPYYKSSNQRLARRRRGASYN